MAQTIGGSGRRKTLDPVWRWIDERLGLKDLSYPVPAHANSVLYTLGGITLFGIVILIATGVYLTQFYHAHPTEARQSVEYIITTARLGDFFRSLHFWMANLVMITLLLHALRVFVSGAYRAPRELNWIVGVGLFGVFMGLVFTGTVLSGTRKGGRRSSTTKRSASCSAAPASGSRRNSRPARRSCSGSSSLTSPSCRSCCSAW